MPATNLHTALAQREMRVERLINRFRFVFLLSLGTLDLITQRDANYQQFLQKIYLYATVAFLLLILIEVFSRSKRYLPWLKYFTVTYDMGFTFWFVIAAERFFSHLLGGTIIFLVIVSFIYLLLNTFSALRADKYVILYSGILALVLNLIQYLYLDIHNMIMYYTSLFILFSTFFNLWVGRLIIRNFILNFELKEANAEITKRNEEILMQKAQLQEQKQKIENYANQVTASIRYAQRIQQAVLPEVEKFGLFFPKYFVIYLPRDIVSGDFYWLYSPSEATVFVAVADCTGHGVPGAFVSMLGIAFLTEIVLSAPELSPKQILERLRRKIKASLSEEINQKASVQDGLDLALCKIDFKQKSLTYAGANNPVYVVKSNTLEIVELTPDHQPIGVYMKERPFSEKTIHLAANDRIYLFTDGIYDQFGGQDNRKFTRKHFKELLLDTANLDIKQQGAIIHDTFKQWKGQNKQTDDVTLIGLEFPG